MKTSCLALCGICLTIPVALAQSGPGPQHQKPFGDGSCLPAYLCHYDVNNDGVIDQEERLAMERARDMIRKRLRADWDTNGDGVIGDQERERARTRLREMILECRIARFEEADANSDGELVYDEFIQLPGMAKKVAEKEDLVIAIFNRLDADGSGTVSESEFLDAVEQCVQARNRFGPGSGGTGSGGTGFGGGK
ncbi:MAG: EF-hand domain-containing protein [Akkermansiaceae bacterium]|nr:EF-hand domain-containing protein [Akkermansiaceae bacterium]